ncbi:hypothetical protein GCM10010400_10110 [Streptomyces aculeolatus]
MIPVTLVAACGAAAAAILTPRQLLPYAGSVASGSVVSFASATSAGADSIASRRRRLQTAQWGVRCPYDEAAERWARRRAFVSCRTVVVIALEYPVTGRPSRKRAAGLDRVPA